METKNNQLIDKEFLVNAIKEASETQKANRRILTLSEEQSSNITKMLEIAVKKSDFRLTDSGYVPEYGFDKEYQELSYRNNRVQIEMNKIKLDSQSLPGLKEVLEVEDSRIDSMQVELDYLNNPKEEKKDE